MELSDKAKKEIEEVLTELQEAYDEAAKFATEELPPYKDVPVVDLEAMKQAHERLKKADQRHRDVMKKYFGFYTHENT